MPRKGKAALRELMEQGHLHVGEELVCVADKSSGREESGRLEADGGIRVGDTTYSSLTAWAKAVAGGKPRDGWLYVRRARDNKLLQEIRDGVSSPPPATVVAYPAVDHSTDEMPPAIASPAPVPESDEARLLERVFRVSPAEFEVLVGEFLRQKGFDEVVVTRTHNDGGIDGHCMLRSVNIKVAFQAKRWQNNVGIDEAQRLHGCVAGDIDRGILVSTSGFTAGTHAWIRETRPKIVLIDGPQLAREMIELGLGIQRVPVLRTEIDEGFFRRLSP